MSTKPRLHLAAALDGAGWHAAAWRAPDAQATELFSPRHWLDQLREAQRGLLDLVTIEDSHRIQSTDPVGPDGRTDEVRGRLDAIMIAARVAPLIRHVGIVPTASTTLTEPFLLSTQIATLDFVSRGRAGWLAQISTRPCDGAYVGPRTIPVGDAVFAEATEHVEVVRRLWDSWEDGAEIRDTAASRFFDRAMVHHIDFEGQHFAVKGPSITPRPPQGQPIVAMLADGEAATTVAVRAADVVFVRPRDEQELLVALPRIDDALAAAGRPPTSLRVLADVTVFLDRDPSAATERKGLLDAFAGGSDGLEALVFTGTPLQLAERLVAWRELGYSGFRLHPGTVPHDLQVITRWLVPELQRRDAFRREYEASTLRGLLGLARPANRYGARPADRYATA